MSTCHLLDRMRPAFRQPVIDDVVELAALPHEGTVILRNVESLDQDGQRELSSWLETSPVGVVTTCTDHLYSRVTEGSFSAGLYYRLNTFTLIAN